MNNLAVFFLAPGRVVGTIALSLCTLVPMAQGSVTIVNNLSQTTDSSFNSNPYGMAQVFTMPSSSADVSSLTLQLAVGGSASVDVYSMSGGVPGSPAFTLGSLSGVAPGNISVNISSYLSNPQALVAGQTYAIVVQPDENLAWNYTDSSSPALGSSFYYDGTSWQNVNTPDVYFQMDLEVSPVPELPITGLVMGFGALALGTVHTFRRRITPSFTGLA